MFWLLIFIKINPYGIDLFALFLRQGVDTVSCEFSCITVDAACVVSGKVVVTFCVTSGATVVTACVTSGAAVAGTAVTFGSDADSVVFIISAVVVDFNKTTLSFAAVASTYTILPNSCKDQKASSDS